jgi:hypothetical protein
MTNTMTQATRPAESVDITPQQKITGPSGKNLVSRVGWNPAAGYDANQARIQSELEVLQQQELERLNRDPAELRVRNLEQAVQALNERLLKLEGQR